MEAANAEGTAGPSLEGRRLKAAAVERVIREGGTGMPGYEGRLDESQIGQLTRFLAR